MKKTKFVLFIVEGQTDEALVGQYFNEYREQHSINEKLKYQVTSGDILTVTPYKKSGIEIVEEEFENHLNKSSLKKSDFVQIIQICDIDGRYFPSENIKKDDNFDRYAKPQYSYAPYKKSIFVATKNRDKLLKTWHSKRDRQNELLQVSSINGVPYSIFYNCFFLEHVLAGRADIRDDEKEDVLDYFIDRNSLSDFSEFLKTKSLSNNYEESWELLKKQDFTEYPSYTNMGIIFQKLESLKA